MLPLRACATVKVTGEGEGPGPAAPGSAFWQDEVATRAEAPRAPTRPTIPICLICEVTPYGPEGATVSRSSGSSEPESRELLHCRRERTESRMLNVANVDMTSPPMRSRLSVAA